MHYTLTVAGRAALQAPDAISLRERQILMLSNGRRPLQRLRALLGDAVEAELQPLLHRGLLAVHGAAADGAIANAVQHDASTWHATAPMHHLSTMPQHSMLLDDLGEDDSAPGPAAGSAQMLAQAFRQGAEQAPQWAQDQLLAQLHTLDEDYANQRPDLPAAQRYMTQVLDLFVRGQAAQTLGAHSQTQEPRQALQYLAQALGVMHSLSGPEATLHAATRLSQLLPMPRRAQLLDSVMDYVPTDFNLRLYEAVLPGSAT